MSIGVVSTALEKFFKDEVASVTKLKKPESNSPEYVNPNVFSGYIPPKNFLPQGFDVPCIVVGVMQGDLDKESMLTVNVTLVIFSDGEYKDGEFTPNMDGYSSMISLIDKSILALTQNPIIGDVCSIEKPIRWKLYEEQPWPIWYGNITFEVNTYTPSYIEKELI